MNKRNLKVNESSLKKYCAKRDNPGLEIQMLHVFLFVGLSSESLGATVYNLE